MEVRVIWPASLSPVAATGVANERPRRAGDAAQVVDLRNLFGGAGSEPADGWDHLAAILHCVADDRGTAGVRQEVVPGLAFLLLAWALRKMLQQAGASGWARSDSRAVSLGALYT